VWGADNARYRELELWRLGPFEAAGVSVGGGVGRTGVDCDTIGAVADNGNVLGAAAEVEDDKRDDGRPVAEEEDEDDMGCRADGSSPSVDIYKKTPPASKSTI
jgi:hypothetical protein